MKKIIILFLFPLSVIASNENKQAGGRSAGLANASVTFTDIWSIQNNQAGLAFHKKISAGIYYENRFLLPELGLKGGAFVLPTKSGTFGVVINSFGYSKYSESKYGIAYARKFGENFSFGLQLNYMDVRIAENYGSNSVFAAEFGVRAKLIDKMHIGFHAFNVNRASAADYNNEKIPTIVRLGIDYQFSDKVLMVAETEKDIDQPAVVKVGLEYHITDPFYVRAGISSNPFQNSFGFGIEKNKLHIDFATSYHWVLGYSPQLSISYDIK